MVHSVVITRDEMLGLVLNVVVMIQYNKVVTSAAIAELQFEVNYVVIFDRKSKLFFVCLRFITLVGKYARRVKI